MEVNGIHGGKGYNRREYGAGFEIRNQEGKYQHDWARRKQKAMEFWGWISMRSILVFCESIPYHFESPFLPRPGLPRTELSIPSPHRSHRKPEPVYHRRQIGRTRQGGKRSRNFVRQMQIMLVLMKINCTTRLLASTKTIGLPLCCLTNTKAILT